MFTYNLFAAFRWTPCPVDLLGNAQNSTVWNTIRFALAKRSSWMKLQPAVIRTSVDDYAETVSEKFRSVCPNRFVQVQTAAIPANLR